MDYYYISASDKFGVAYSMPDVDSVSLLPNSGEIRSWVPIDLYVKRNEWEGPLVDYIHNDLGIHLCSKRLKELLENIRSDYDKVQWLPSYVTDLEENHVEYNVLHFPEPPDILNLDPGETIYDEDTGILIRPCISQCKAEKHRFLISPECTSQLSSMKA